MRNSDSAWRLARLWRAGSRRGIRGERIRALGLRKAACGSDGAYSSRYRSLLSMIETDMPHRGRYFPFDATRNTFGEFRGGLASTDALSARRPSLAPGPKVRHDSDGRRNDERAKRGFRHGLPRVWNHSAIYPT